MLGVLSYIFTYFYKSHSFKTIRNCKINIEINVTTAKVIPSTVVVPNKYKIPIVTNRGTDMNTKINKIFKRTLYKKSPINLLLFNYFKITIFNIIHR